jgi:hypothetical protein
MKKTIYLTLVILAGCSQRADVEPQPAPDAQLPVAPWQSAPLRANNVAPVYLEQWQQAENRASCASIAFANVGSAGRGATPRAATFSGGWAVAYDLPNSRSAFGVAGTGVLAAEPAYDDWPYHLRWRDGSSAGYGPEGGTGPKQLAYLRIAGQGCLYNVWSRLGRAHLEELLQGIRLVQ